MTNFTPATIAAAGDRLRSGKVTCVDLLEECLARIDLHELRVRAWVTVDAEGARTQAQRRDQDLLAGRDLGPLHGIPVTVKDVIDVAGLPTRAGSPLLSGRMADTDASSVARLRGAGAVIVGKSVTTQFAFDDPPVTRNPWRLTRTPGGSSSGPAAAVAAGMSLAGLGTQTGGSLLRPASYCGLAALKPTWGRLSVFGVVPLAFNLDHVGVMAADCAGLAALMDALAGGGHSDPFTADVPPLECVRALTRPLEAPRLGQLTGFFEQDIDGDVSRVVDEALATVTAAGGSVTPVNPPPSTAGVREHNRELLAIQAAFAHREHFPAERSAYLPLITGLLDEGLRASVTAMPDVFLHRQDFRAGLLQALDGCDALITATTATTAPDVTTTGQSKFNAPFSYAGFPSVTVPVGLGQDGMPVGLQLVGGPWREDALLRTATWVERQVAFDARATFVDREA